VSNLIFPQGINTNK